MEFLPEEASVKNPVDMIASARHDTYAKTVELLLSDKNIDGIIVIIVRPPVDTTPKRIAGEIAGIRKKFAEKPLLCVVMAQPDEEVDLAFFRDNNLPVYQYPENAAKALNKMALYNNLIQLDYIPDTDIKVPVDKIRELLKNAKSQKREFLNQT